MWAPTLIAALGTVEIIILLVIFAVPFGLVVYSIIDIVRSKFINGNSKLLFLILVLFAPLIGCILYFILKRNYIVKEQGFNRFP